MQTIIVTGATGSLGRALCKILNENEDCHVVIAARDQNAGYALVHELGSRASFRYLDLASISSIQKFVAEWNGPIGALVNNAGGQFHGRTRLTDDNIEATLAINHLGAFQLTLGLLPWLHRGAVINVSSGTHNPNDRSAKLFGFRGGRLLPVSALAKGGIDTASPRQAALDRYATSKLLLMTTSVELSRRCPNVRFINFDPGLMPGTGLARTAPLPVRIAWNTVLRWAVPLLPGASTVEKSAKIAAGIVLEDWAKSGETYGHSGELEPVWSLVKDPAFGRQTFEESLDVLVTKGALDRSAALLLQPLPAA